MPYAWSHINHQKKLIRAMMRWWWWWLKLYIFWLNLGVWKKYKFISFVRSSRFTGCHLIFFILCYYIPYMCDDERACTYINKNIYCNNKQLWMICWAHVVTTTTTKWRLFQIGRRPLLSRARSHQTRPRTQCNLHNHTHTHTVASSSYFANQVCGWWFSSLLWYGLR